MRPSLRMLHVHKPMIRFIGRRTWPSTPEPPHAHPAAPPQYKAHFDDFLRKFESSSSRWSSSQSTSASSKLQNSRPNEKHDNDEEVYPEFWQAPARLWNPRATKLSEEEIEAIASGGASLF